MITASITVEQLETSRIRLNARTAGSGELVLLLHGITAGAVIWDPVIADLARDHRVVAIDQRGHGDSEHPDAGYTADDYVADVAAVLEKIGPARAVVGHSLGGRNALLAGAAMPERIGCVVSVDHAATIEPSVFSALRSTRMAGEGALPDLASVRRALQARSPLLPADAIERRATHLFVAGDDGYRPKASAAAIAETLETIDTDLVPVLRDSTIPMLLIRGGRSTYLTEAALMRSLWLRGDLIGSVVADADHFIPEEQPTELAAQIRQFIAG